MQVDRNYVFTCPVRKEVPVSSEEVTPSDMSTWVTGCIVVTGREKYSGKKLETQGYLLKVRSL